MGSLITKESVLNEFTYVKVNFFKQLLEKSVENGIITLEEWVKYRDGMAQVILNCAYEETTDVEIFVTEAREQVIENHFYIVSLYLSTFKPSKALEKIKNTSSFKLHDEAIRYYEKTLSDECMKLKEFKNVINTSKEIRLFTVVYNEIMDWFRVFLNYNDHSVVLNSTTIVIPEYPFMNQEWFNDQDAIFVLSQLVKTFIIEVNIRNKFDKKTMNEVKRLNSDKNKKDLKDFIKFEANIKWFAAEKKIRTAIEKKYADIAKGDDYFDLLFGKLKEEELQNALDFEREIIEKEQEEKLKNLNCDFEIYNNLVSTLVELICVLLKFEFPDFKIPDTMIEKFKTLKNKVPKELIFEILFSHEEVVKFSAEEKEYLQEYFLGRLVVVEE